MRPPTNKQFSLLFPFVMMSLSLETDYLWILYHFVAYFKQEMVGLQLSYSFLARYDV